VRNPLPAIVDWLRAGYPDDAPSTGYSPLVALTGPISLSDRQIREAVTRLGADTRDKAGIEVAITKVTGHLPNPSQVQQVSDSAKLRLAEERTDHDYVLRRNTIQCCSFGNLDAALINAASAAITPKPKAMNTAA
jgi:Protein of unknown function (DUF3349)